MKITCPSCGTDNTTDASADQLIDASCQKCGAILPAAGARESLDDLRSELEAEVGPIFAEDPNREIQTTPLRFGAGAEDAPRSSSSPSVPAFKVVDASASRPLSPLPGGTLESAVEDHVAASCQEPGENANSEEEINWSPATSELSSLIEEQYSVSREAEKADRDDDMLKPPEIKPKARETSGPPPPLAFDEDFKGASDPHMKAIRPQGGRLGSMIGQAAVEIEVEAPRRHVLWVVAMALAFIVVVGLLSVIVVLLWLDKNHTPTVAGPVATALVPPSAPAAVAVKTDAAVSRDAGASNSPPDAATKSVATPDASTTSVAARPDPAKPADAPQVTPGKPAAIKPRRAAPMQPQPSRKPRVAWKRGEDDTPRKKPPRGRPKGCDPVLFPEPRDCPRAGPPGKGEILEVVRENLRDIDVCAKKQFAADPALASGVVLMRFTIRPTGRTSKVGVVSAEFKGSVVGACLTQKIQDWSFGAFDGRAVGPIKFPFKLKTR